MQAAAHEQQQQQRQAVASAQRQGTESPQQSRPFLPAEVTDRIINHLMHHLAADVSFLLLPSDVEQYAEAPQDVSSAPPGRLVRFAEAALQDNGWLLPGLSQTCNSKY